jgi:DNA primase
MKDLNSVIDLVKERVSLREILVAQGKITGSGSEEQFSCLFHGVDRKKSSRYYRETDTAYCWVCKEKWDVISFCQKLEQMTFHQALNYLIKTYKIDISRLPDAAEAEILKIQKREIVKIDERRFSTEKLYEAINAVRDEVAFDTYTKFVYTYMMLKYAIPDEKFKEMFEKFKEKMLAVFEKQMTNKMEIVK